MHDFSIAPAGTIRHYKQLRTLVAHLRDFLYFPSQVIEDVTFLFN